MFKTKNLHDHFNTNFKKPKQLGTYLNKLFFLKEPLFNNFVELYVKILRFIKTKSSYIGPILFIVVSRTASQLKTNCTCNIGSLAKK